MKVKKLCRLLLLQALLVAPLLAGIVQVEMRVEGMT
jgi:hypothetical protein